MAATLLPWLLAVTDREPLGPGSPQSLEQSHICGSLCASRSIKGVSGSTPAWDMQGTAGLGWELHFQLI